MCRRFTPYILLGLLVVLPGLSPTWAQRPVPARTAQISRGTVEPPSDGGPRLAAPAGPVVDPATPVVSVRVRVPAVAAPDQDLEYRVCVQNESPAAAHHVQVRLSVPAGARLVRTTPEATPINEELVWRLGTMAGCTCKELRVVVRPEGAGDLQACARVQFEHGQCVRTQIAQPGTVAPRVPSRPPSQPPLLPQTPEPSRGLTLRKTGPAQVTLYDAATFTIEVGNDGTTPLENVELTDLLPRELRYDADSARPAPSRRALLTWDIGRLAPGDRRTYSYRALTTKEGTFTNRAVVTAAGGIRREASSRVVVGKAELKLSVRGPTTRYASQPATFEYTVENAGTAPATNVILSNPLPIPLKIESVSDGGRIIENQVDWNLGVIPGGTKKTVRLVLSARAAGEYVQKPRVKADRDLTASAEIRTTFRGLTGLTARITDTDPVEVKQQTSYIIVVKNTGTADAQDVQVTALVPIQMQATDAQGPVQATVAQNRVEFKALVIKPGEEVRFVVHVKALKAGDVRLRVEIRAKELTAGPLIEEESTTIAEELPG